MIKETDILSLKKEIELLNKRITKMEIDVKNNENVNKSKKTKNVKDINAPKKFKSAYMFFNIENINEYKKKYPDVKIKVSEIAKESGKQWKIIKNDDKKYNKYKKLEDNDKKRYEKEIELYKNKTKQNDYDKKIIQKYKIL